ncbi:unnamed protein product [Vitrella brassicaformis CCMP3155]|uniref:Apple domain-containing protein n=1 Tax=Vitrella brassicaformis (strain CCMP3155) TaxID=1169540 RepID=A0A0G4EN36_VITBC|nr:unnamed protein product [Vitrella brassicaformis CCMP3155]|eukprot:CEL99247.1 unnamed protein product [Vitrella brassicaformis CCMP3155]
METIIVNNTAAGKAGEAAAALHKAIEAANGQDGADDVISFQVEGTASAAVDVVVSEPLPVIKEGLTIRGPGSGRLRIVKAYHGRPLFQFDEGAGPAVVQGVTLAIHHPSTSTMVVTKARSLTLTDVVIKGVKKHNSGRGIYCEAGGRGGVHLTLDAVEIAHMKVHHDDGGGILANCGLTVRSSEVHFNAAGRGAGIFLGPMAQKVDISATKIMNNHANAEGGGIFATQPTSKDNETSAASPPLVLHESLVVGNSATNGGGLFAGRRANITHTVLMVNQAPEGGGIHFSRRSGGSVVRGVSVEGNQGNTGGGIMCNAPVQIEDTTLRQNRARGASSYGGGLSIGKHCGTPTQHTTITDSFIQHNLAHAGGGMAVDTPDAHVDIVRTTISSNVAEGHYEGGGGGVWIGQRVASLSFRESIVAANEYSDTTSEGTETAATARRQNCGSSSEEQPGVHDKGGNWAPLCQHLLTHADTSPDAPEGMEVRHSVMPLPKAGRPSHDSPRSNNSNKSRRETQAAPPSVPKAAAALAAATNKVFLSCFEDGVEYGVTTNATHPLDLGSARVTNIHACQELCQQSPNCQAFSYMASDRICYLKAAEEPTKPNADLTSGPRECEDLKSRTDDGRDEERDEGEEGEESGDVDVSDETWMDFVEGVTPEMEKKIRLAMLIAKLNRATTDAEEEDSEDSEDTEQEEVDDEVDKDADELAGLEGLDVGGGVVTEAAVAAVARRPPKPYPGATHSPNPNSRPNQVPRTPPRTPHAHRYPPCFQLGVGYHFPTRRGDLGDAPNVTSARVCQRLCQWKPSCHVFVFDQKKATCYFKGQGGRREAKIGMVSGPRACDDSLIGYSGEDNHDDGQGEEYWEEPTAAPAEHADKESASSSAASALAAIDIPALITGDGGCFEMGVEYSDDSPDSNLASVGKVASLLDCRDACSSRPACLFFTFDPHKYMCHLKDERLPVRANAHVISGPRVCGEQAARPRRALSTIPAATEDVVMRHRTTAVAAQVDSPTAARARVREPSWQQPWPQSPPIPGAFAVVLQKQQGATAASVTLRAAIGHQSTAGVLLTNLFTIASSYEYQHQHDHQHERAIFFTLEQPPPETHPLPEGFLVFLGSLGPDESPERPTSFVRGEVAFTTVGTRQPVHDRDDDDDPDDGYRLLRPSTSSHRHLQHQQQQEGNTRVPSRQCLLFRCHSSARAGTATIDLRGLLGAEDTNGRRGASLTDSVVLHMECVKGR